jgi:hypothetical protein
VIAFMVTRNIALGVAAIVGAIALVAFAYIKKMPQSNSVALIEQPPTIQRPSPNTSASVNASANASREFAAFTANAHANAKDNAADPPLQPDPPQEPMTQAERRLLPSLADTAPAMETTESRVGRSLLLRQNADFPVPESAQTEFNRELRRLAPLPAGPNMQRIAQ